MYGPLAQAEYEDELRVGGLAWLDSFGDVLTGVRFELNETDAAKWRRHFDLGDLVTVYDADFDVDKVAEIKEVNYTRDADGVEHIELLVGQPQPTKWELLQAGMGVYSSFDDNSSPNVPTGLAATTGLAQNTDGWWYAFLRATWNRNVELDLGGYEIRWVIDGKETTRRVAIPEGAHTTISDYQFPVANNVSYWVAVRAVDTAGNPSAYCAPKTGTTPKDEIPPAVPTGLTVTPAKKSIRISVEKNAEPDWAGNEFHVSTVNNFNPSSATLVHSGKTTSHTHSCASYVAHYVKVRAYDTANPPNFSAYTVQGSATPEQIDGSADIPNNNIPGDKIISIVAHKITGEIVNAQIATIDFAKIYNVQIHDAQIVNLSVTKLVGKIKSAQIESLSVDQLTAGNLTVGVGFGSGGYFEVPGVFRIDSFGVNIVGQNALKFGTTGPAYLFNQNDYRLYTSGGFVAASLTVPGSATFEGSIWMPSGNRIFQLVGSTPYLQNCAIQGGVGGVAVTWVGDMQCSGVIRSSGEGQSYFVGDVRIDGELNVWSKIKNAVVQTSQGPVCLAAMESPEVWFVDVVDDEMDPLFEEVCEGDFHYLPVYPNRGAKKPSGWLVLGKRRGFADRRFAKA